MTEEQELIEVKETIIDYATEIFCATNKRFGEINLALEKLGVEDKELYFHKFEVEQDFDTLNGLMEKLDIYELDLLKAIIGCASTYGMEVVMTPKRRKTEIQKLIDERYEFWLKELEVSEDEE